MSREIIDIQIGKNGFTEAQILDIKNHLKKTDVKLKFLKSFISDKNRKVVAEEIQKKLNTKGKLIGNTLLIRGNNG